MNEIDLIQNGGQIPLVVGGTNYFVESLLFNFNNEDNSEIKNEYNPIEILDKNIKNENLLEKIKKIENLIIFRLILFMIK